MKRSADVRSIDALRKAKFALVEFREAAQVSLAEAFSDAQRTLSWLQREKRGHWQRELRRRAEKVNQAKSELYRAQLSAGEDRASCVEQKKLLQRAEQALAEARQKAELVQRWSRVLDREIMLFKGRCQPLARAVDAELPRGEARLDLLLERLEAYLRLQAPATAETPRRTGGADEHDANAATPDGAEDQTP